ncbi:hypothetical protein [Ferrimonas pelagia]|uniref:Uncharacterized protein n=1 Tax=Ferrimonas pelagia TaxID=1177826 RepID=A0ABP9FHW0_9GAMM
MFSQSLPAQLLRWAALLILSLILVHHCQPLLDVLAQDAVNAGCHSMDNHDGHDMADPDMTDHTSHHTMGHHQ